METHFFCLEACPPHEDVQSEQPDNLDVKQNLIETERSSHFIQCSVETLKRVVFFWSFSVKLFLNLPLCLDKLFLISFSSCGFSIDGITLLIANIRSDPMRLWRIHTVFNRWKSKKTLLSRDFYISNRTQFSCF